MAKRFADCQITRETFKEKESGSDEEESSHKFASADVMSKRKIALPKRKMAATFNKQPLNNQTAPVDTSAGAFGFLKGQNSNDSDKNARLKALNLQFKEKVSSIVDNDACADLSPVLNKYMTFIKTIKDSQSNPTISKSDVTSKTVEVLDEKSDSSSAEEDDEARKEIKVEGPKFTIKTKPPTSDSVFSFGATKKVNENQDDSDSDSEIKGPQFTFSGTVKSDVFKLSTPPGEKKISNTAGTNASEPVDKPAGPFVLPAQPAFALENNSNSDNKQEKPTFTFGGSKEDKNENKTFAFGQPKQQEEQKNEAKPKFDFSFGSNIKKNEPSNETKKPSFSFQFGAGTGQKEEKIKPTMNIPSFSFGKSGQDPNSGGKPAFSFGATNASAAPSFTFGNVTATDSATKGDNKSNGNSNTNGTNSFKFSLPFGQKAPESDAVMETSNAAMKEEKDVNKEEVDQNNKHEEVKPIDLQNGEEDETPLFTQRAKLMIFNNETKAYDSKGVGELKLLQSKEDKSKIRLLCRSDGMGHILLNTRIVKDFSYSPLTADNENLVKIPTIEAENKLVTYVTKFKQKDDGRQFVKTIEDVKQYM